MMANKTTRSHELAWASIPEICQKYRTVSSVTDVDVVLGYSLLRHYSQKQLRIIQRLLISKSKSYFEGRLRTSKNGEA
jgi:hypothetical protein